MRVGVVFAMVLVGCGRLGFEEPDAATDSSGDGPPADVAVDGQVVGPGTTTFGETPTANVTNVTSDAYVSNETGSTMANYGASTSLGCEGSEKRALVRFDLSALLPATPVTSTQLHLQFSGSSTTVMVHPVLEAWTEGTQNGTAGVVNHVQRTAGTSWTTAGAGFPGSVGASIMSFAAVPGANTVTLPAATIQGWINSPSTNFGVVIACGGDTNISSSENATTTSRPQLDVTHQ